MTYNYERRLAFPEEGFDAPQDRFGSERKPELVIATQNFIENCSMLLGAGLVYTGVKAGLGPHGVFIGLALILAGVVFHQRILPAAPAKPQ